MIGLDIKLPSFAICTQTIRIPGKRDFPPEVTYIHSRRTAVAAPNLWQFQKNGMNEIYCYHDLQFIIVYSEHKSA